MDFFEAQEKEEVNRKTTIYNGTILCLRGYVEMV